MNKFDEKYNQFLSEVTDLSTESGQAKADQKREKHKQEIKQKQAERQSKKEKDDEEETENLDMANVDSIQIKLKK